MKKNDALFSLIKTLTKSEKRYFKMTVGFHGREQKYLKLFDQIDRMHFYDEARLRKQLEGEPLLNQLHVAKNYLYNLVLKSLRGYHLKESTTARLRSQLIDVEVLFKKDLLVQCYRVVRRVEKLARRAGDELILLEALNWKRRTLLNIRRTPNYGEELDRIIEEEKEIIVMLDDENKFWKLALSAGGGAPEKVLEKSNHRLLFDDSSKKTHRALILQHHLQYVYYTISDKLDEAGNALDDLIIYLESDQFRLKNDPSSYITALNNKVGLYLNQKKHRLIPDLLQKIRKIPEHLQLKAGNPVSMKLLQRTYNVELETYRDTGKVDQAIEVIPKIRAFLKKYGELVSREYLILFHYQFSYLYFMAGDFRNSLKDVNVVLDHRYDADRVDIVGYAYFLNLIIHYELGNTTVMKYSVEACRRFIKKRGNLMEFEKVLLRLFSRLSTQPQYHHRGIIEKAMEQLFSYPPLMDDSQIDYLDFKHWMETKL